MQDKMITYTMPKMEAKTEKIYSTNRKITRTESDMPEIMWHVLRSMNVFSNYIYPMNIKMYYIPRDLALFPFQIITVPPHLPPLNTVFLVSFVGNGEQERSSRM